MQACHSKFVKLIFIQWKLSILKYLNSWSNKKTLNSSNNFEKTERPYKLEKKYKDTIQKDIENMLEEGIIYPIDKLECDIPMVVYPTKEYAKRLRVCINIKVLNKVTLTYHFPTPSSNDIVNQVVGHACYSFTNGYFGYNQVRPIIKEY